MSAEDALNMGLFKIRERVKELDEKEKRIAEEKAILSELINKTKGKLNNMSSVWTTSTTANEFDFDPPAIREPKKMKP